MALDRIRLLAEVRNKTNQHLFLRLGEELQAVNIGDDTVLVLVKTCQLAPLARGYKVTATGMKLITLTYNLETSRWDRESMVAWDEPITPYELDSYGGLSPDEYRERREWEDDCYRPGNGSRLGQRDSADRVFQGYDYSNPLFYSTTTQKG